MKTPPGSHGAYVLRLVADPSDPDRLAGRLEHVPSGRRHDFDDASALLACLRHEQRCAGAARPDRNVTGA
jgi:hypothetical protein